MKKIILPIIIALVPGLVKAQEAMSFVTVPHETATLSLGQTISSPASLTDHAGVAASVGYLQWAPDAVASNDISARTSWSNGSFGFGFEYTGQFGPDVPIMNGGGFPTGSSVKTSTIQLGLGAAYKFASKYSFGADFHYASESLGPEAAYSAFYANVAASAQFNSLSVGGGLARIGSSVTDDLGVKYSLPASAFVNGAYSVDFSEALSLKAMAEAQMYFTGGLGIGAGAQLSIVDILHLRAGYHLGADAPVPSFLSLGAGVTFAGVSIETCFLTASPTIGNTVGIALGFKF